MRWFNSRRLDLFLRFTLKWIIFMLLILFLGLLWSFHGLGLFLIDRDIIKKWISTNTYVVTSKMITNSIATILHSTNIVLFWFTSISGYFKLFFLTYDLLIELSNNLVQVLYIFNAIRASRLSTSLVYLQLLTIVVALLPIILLLHFTIL